MIKDYFKGALTIPNLLSVVRIILVPVFAWLFYNGHTLGAVVVLVISGLTDFFDGKIARRFNQISELGKMLDPLADKLTQITIAVLLFIMFNRCENSMMRGFSYVFLVFIAKEALMVIGAVLMIIFGIKPGAAEIYGKVATFAFYAVMAVLFTFGPEVGALREYFVLPNVAVMVLVIISAVLTLVAFCSYLPAVFKQVKERKAQGNK